MTGVGAGGREGAGDRSAGRFAGRRVLVAGAGVAGEAAVRALLAAQADVTVVDERESAVLEELAGVGARPVVARTGPGRALPDNLFNGVSDVVVSPGFAPHHPLAAAAVAAGLDVYSEPELAWRLRRPQAPAWLAVTGTNGKTTTVTMLAAILRAAGLRAEALGNIGVPLVGVTADRTQYDVVVAELSSFQLHWSRELAPEFGAILNIAADHLEWHGDFDRYSRSKLAVWRAASAGGTALGNLDDGWIAARMGELSGQVVGWTLGAPGPGQLGVVDGVLTDAAFGDHGPGPSGQGADVPGPGGPGAGGSGSRGPGVGGRGSISPVTAVELTKAEDIRPPGAHNVSNALAAAALALGYGVPAAAVREGLCGYQPQPHRNALVTTVGEVRYVDDSKATNPHAALASLLAYPRVVWVAGGQLKGVDVDDLVARVAGRLSGVVLLGVDRAQLAEALGRHVPGVPVVDVAATDDSAMGRVVRAAAGLARPGDTVLLAPAAASLDMYRSYAARGEAFADEVRSLAELS